MVKAVKGKPIVKLSGYLAVLLLIVILLSAALVQTSWFRGWLKDYAVEAINQNLSGKFSIGRIEGNLFSQVIISEILLQADRDTLLYVPRVMMTHSLSALISRTVSIRSILIDKPFLNLVQYPDGSWNFARLMKPDSLEDEVQPERKSTLPEINIFLHEFRLNGASIQIAARDPLIPSSIRDINVLFSGLYTAGRQEVYLQKFHLHSVNPDYILENMSFKLMRDQQQISLREFALSSRLNHIDATGSYQSGTPPVIQGAAYTAPLDFAEFQFALPEILLPIHPEISLETEYRNDSLRLDMRLTLPDQEIMVKARLSDIMSTLQDKIPAKAGYTLQAHLSGVHLSKWLNNPDLDLLLNGKIELTGLGISLEEAEAELRMNLSQSRVFHHPLDTLLLNARFAGGKLEGQLTVGRERESLQVSGTVSNITGHPSYDLDLQTRHLDLAMITGNDTLGSDLNLHVKAAGRGFDPGQIQSDLQMGIYHSTLAGIRIDTIFSNIRVHGRQFILDTLQVRTDLGRLDLSGVVSPESNNRLRFLLSPGDLSLIRRWVALDEVRAGGHLSGTVEGTLDSLHLYSEIHLEQIIYQEYQAEAVNGTVILAGNLESFTGNTDIQIYRPALADFTLEKLAIGADFSRQWANIEISLAGKDKLKADLRTRVEMDSTIRLIIPHLTLGFRDQFWQGGTDHMRVNIDGSDFHIENFIMQGPSSSAEPRQEIHIDGLLSLDSTEALTIQLQRVNIGDWAAAFEVSRSVAGRVSLDVELSGTAGAPLLSGRFSLRDGQIDHWQYQGFDGNFDYREKQLSWDFILRPTITDSLKLDGFLPLELSLEDLSRNHIDVDRDFALRLRTDRLPLSMITVAGIKTRETGGYLEGQLQFGGTLRQPLPEGYLRLRDGTFFAPHYGIDWRKINLNVEIDPHLITLQNFSLVRDAGTLNANGQIHFFHDGNSVSFKDLQFTLTAGQIFLIRHPDYELQADGHLTVSGNPENLNYTGRFTIPRASILLSGLTASKSPETDPTLPLLVLEREKTTRPEDSTVSVKVRETTRPSVPDTLKFLRNLTGRLVVTAPRNTWIKQTNMAIELAYDLEIIQRGVMPEIIGRVELVRGYYNLLGRRFTFVDSRIFFDGGTEINPRLEITIEYTLRTTSRDKKTMEIRLRDYAQTPKITFLLDNKVIEESEAFSYLLYGKSQQELSAGEQSDLNSTTNILASYLSNQLGSAISNKIGVDVLEVSSEDNWESASVAVGKYIAPDVFVRYEQRFGEDTSEDIAKQLVTLEYEISRAILLQLVGGSARNSGFDLIFKFQRE